MLPWHVTSGGDSTWSSCSNRLLLVQPRIMIENLFNTVAIKKFSTPIPNQVYCENLDFLRFAMNKLKLIEIAQHN